MIVAQKKHTLRNKFDKYITPYSLTQQLLDSYAVDKDEDILEPCSSVEGCIVKVLRQNGFTRITESVYDPDKEETDIMNMKDNSCDIIITNTPYGKDIIPFVKKMKAIARKEIIALYPMSTLHSTSRYDALWCDKDYPLTNVLMFSRPPWLKDTVQEDGKYNTGINAYAWFVWKKGGEANNVKLSIIDNSKNINRKKVILS
jgi:hypothetical protein